MYRDLSNVNNMVLPALSGSSLTYNIEKNVYLTNGYTSKAGNTYYRAIMCSDRLVIYYELGQGDYHTFLNGITIYAWNGQKANIIARRTWGGHNNYMFYNESSAREECINMLKGYLENQANVMRCSFSDGELYCFARKIVNEAQERKQIG